MKRKHSSIKRTTESLRRQPPSREVKPRILIMCEGEKTEPNYFRAFKITSAHVKIFGEGMNTDSLVEECIRTMEEAEEIDEKYDVTWCVFDKDSFTNYQFNRARDLAKSNGIKVAYSIEAFELWYLLHFIYCDTGIPRRDYCTKLTHYLERDYEKNDSNLYIDLLPMQDIAIRRAKRLHGFNKNCENPSTTVYELVEFLNSFL